MKTFNLKPDYQVLTSTIGSMLISLALGITFYNRGTLYTWERVLYPCIFVLITIYFVYVLYRAFRKEKAVIDDNAIRFGAKEYLFQNIERVTFYKDRLVLLLKEKNKRENIESRRFQTSDWDEFVSLIKKMPQAAIA